MMSKSVRERFVGQYRSDLESYLLRLFPLGEMKFNGHGGLVFNTGLSANHSQGAVVIEGANDVVIITGMYVDDDDRLQIYDRYMKIEPAEEKR